MRNESKLLLKQELTPILQEAKIKNISHILNQITEPLRSIQQEPTQKQEAIEQFCQIFDELIIDQLEEKLLANRACKIQMTIISIESNLLPIESTLYHKLMKHHEDTRKEVIATIKPIEVPAYKTIEVPAYLSILESYLLSGKAKIPEDMTIEIICKFKKDLILYDPTKVKNSESLDDYLNLLSKETVKLLLTESLNDLVSQKKLTGKQKKDIVKHTLGVRFAEKVDIAMLPKGKKGEYKCKYKNEENSNAPEQKNLIKIWLDETQKYQENLKTENLKKKNFKEKDSCTIM
ncbi:hypothetical protein L3V86_04475 [Thiotrichales bacterium 19S11-10]|nr:hypothetical protein [Thiotrichales bacterium 19S11-10]